MLRLYLDEDVSERLVDALEALGLDVLSANRGAKGLDDARQVLRAVALGRVLATHNTGDYRLLHEAWHAWSEAWDLRTLPHHRGILLLHSAKGFEGAQLAPVVNAFVESVGEGDIDDRAFAWNPRRGWHEV